MLHPFSWIPERHHGRLLAVLALLLAGLTAALAWIGAPLVTAAAPQGIVSFELAGSEATARAILASWTPAQRERAQLCQGLDGLYLFVYPALLSLACVRVAGSASGFARVARATAWAVLAAAPLDAVENLALVQLLLSGPSEGWAQLARACAVPKFALVGLGCGVAGAGYVSKRFRAHGP